MPFGRIEESDSDRLQEFAAAHRFDLKAERARVYGSNGANRDALGRVFVFARQFNALDKNVRTYGQIIYSGLLNIGEHIGVPAYAKIVDRQPADVQQRIRDFLFYPIAHNVPKAQWNATLDENRQMYPGLFPKDFEFSHGDPIFAKEAKPSDAANRWPLPCLTFLYEHMSIAGHARSAGSFLPLEW